jgi:hypothetical protein
VIDLFAGLGPQNPRTLAQIDVRLPALERPPGDRDLIAALQRVAIPAEVARELRRRAELRRPADVLAAFIRNVEDDARVRIDQLQRDDVPVIVTVYSSKRPASP